MQTPKLKLNPSHEAYKLMDTFLRDAAVYDAHVAADFAVMLGEVCTLTDPECHDVLRVMCDVSKVRSMTGKRVPRLLSPALTVLCRHAKSPEAHAHDERSNSSAKAKMHL